MGKGPEQTLLQKGHTSGQQKYMKRCSTSLIVREMKIKTTMRYHLTPAKIIIINKSTNNKCWQRWGERGTLLHHWWKCRLMQPLWRAVWSYLKKLKMKLPYDPGIPLLGTYLKKPETLILRNVSTPRLIEGLFTIFGSGPSVFQQMSGETAMAHLYRLAVKSFSIFRFLSSSNIPIM